MERGGEQAGREDRDADEARIDRQDDGGEGEGKAIAPRDQRTELWIVENSLVERG